MPVEQVINLLIASDAKMGAKNITEDGSSFDVDFPTPITFPSDAKRIKLSVTSATVWWSVPNISADIGNNSVTVTFVDNDGVLATRTILLKKGIYKVKTLFASINDQFEVEHNAPTGLLGFRADHGTGFTTIRLRRLNTTLHMSAANSLATILGFSPTEDLEYAQAGDDLFIAESTSKFNHMDYFLIHSDLTMDGIPTNSKYSQTIARVLVEAKVGRQIIYRPFNPTIISCPHLKGGSVNSMRFWLTDQDNNPVDTNGFQWSAEIMLTWS
jgi:hypothetical protein